MNARAHVFELVKLGVFYTTKENISTVPQGSVSSFLKVLEAKVCILPWPLKPLKMTIQAPVYSTIRSFFRQTIRDWNELPDFFL